MRDKLIVALDVDCRDDAMRLVAMLRDHVGLFKVGLELFTACGPDIIHDIGGEQVFLDLKFHDIPNTSAGAARVVTSLGVRMFNVHAAGGREMMTAAKLAAEETARNAGIKAPIVLGVTVLTSLDEIALHQQLRIDERVDIYVAHLAQLAREAGLDGVVCSPREIDIVRQTVGTDFLIVTPGVRPKSAQGDMPADDQKRILTPRDAINAGANYLVIGRPITRAQNPVDAAKRIVEEMSAGA